MSIIPPPARHSSSIAVHVLGGVDAEQLIARRQRRFDAARVRASPRRRAPPRRRAGARRSRDAGRCRARKRTGGGDRAPRLYRTRALTAAPDTAQRDVAVIGGGRRGPLHSAFGGGAWRSGVPGVAKAAVRERQLLGPGRAGGGAGGGRLTRSATPTTRSTPAAGRAGPRRSSSSPARLRARSRSCSDSGSGSTRPRTGGWRSASREGTRRAGSCTRAAARRVAR